MEHTPGPWKVEGRFEVVTDEGFPLAMVEHDDGFVMDDQAAADARLIAAAPDLLAAAESWVAVHQGTHATLYDKGISMGSAEMDVTVAMERAIKQAKGEA